MLANIFEPPYWVGVLVVVVTYLLLGTAVVLLWISIGSGRLDRRRGAGEVVDSETGSPHTVRPRAAAATHRRRRGF